MWNVCLQCVEYRVSMSIELLVRMLWTNPIWSPHWHCTVTAMISVIFKACFGNAPLAHWCQCDKSQLFPGKATAFPSNNPRIHGNASFYPWSGVLKAACHCRGIRVSLPWSWHAIHMTSGFLGITLMTHNLCIQSVLPGWTKQVAGAGARPVSGQCWVSPLLPSSH